MAIRNFNVTEFTYIKNNIILHKNERIGIFAKSPQRKTRQIRIELPSLY